MSKIRVRWRILSAAAVLLAVFVRPAAGQAISNGGFEDNGGAGFPAFTNWTAADQPGSAGSFFVQTGTGTPLFGSLVPPPPEGLYAAMTDSGGAGAHILYQDFFVPFGTNVHTLSFQVFTNNQAGDFTAPNTLDFFAGENQQARADLMLSGADPFSVDDNDILLNLFQTDPGDPLTSGYTLVTQDITGVLAAHQGETLRLRFAEVDNVQPLNLGIDDVRLTDTPEPSALAFFTISAISSSLFVYRIRRRRKP